MVTYIVIIQAIQLALFNGPRGHLCYSQNCILSVKEIIHKRKNLILVPELSAVGQRIDNIMSTSITVGIVFSRPED